jgi:hypothetical protein
MSNGKLELILSRAETWLVPCCNIGTAGIQRIFGLWSFLEHIAWCRLKRLRSTRSSSRTYRAGIENPMTQQEGVSKP